jgi:hypothetical protein
MIPPGRIKDGHNLKPDSFYTYQIMFVPDLSQKYGLTVWGKAGEVRAAMNLVNGWMYTGMGPFYLKDSSTAQNIMAVGVASLFAGRGASDVLDSVAGLASTAGARSKQERAPVDGEEFIDRVARIAKVIQSQTLTPKEMLNYAEVAIYEPMLTPEGGMHWFMIAHHNFNRQYFSPDMDKPSCDLIQGLLNELEPNGGSPKPGPGVTTDPPPAEESASEEAGTRTLQGGGPALRPAEGDLPPPTDGTALPPLLNSEGLVALPDTDSATSESRTTVSFRVVD